MIAKLVYSQYRMTDNSKDTTAPDISKQTAKIGLIDQWGGKFAFFFTYMHMSHDLISGLLPALLPFIRQDLNLNYLQTGLLVTAYSLTSGLSQLLGGWLSDRMSKTKAIALGLGGVGLSGIAISFAPNYHVLLVTLVILGIFAGFYHPSAISALSSHFEARRRGRVVALHMIGGGLGFGLGPFLGAIISNQLNWHFAFAILGIPPLVAAALVFSRLKLASPKLQEGTSPSQHTPRSLKDIWHVFKPSIGIIIISVAMQLVSGPVMSFIPLFLMDIYNLSATAGSMWITIIRLGGLAGNLVGGWLIDKWGRRNTIFMILIMFGPVVMLISKIPFGFALGVVFILFGWLMAIRETAMQTLLMDNSPPHLRATIIGIYFSFGQQGSSIIQPLAGDFMDTFGISGVFNVIGWLSIGLSLLAVLLVLKGLRGKKGLDKNYQA